MNKGKNTTKIIYTILVIYYLKRFFPDILKDFEKIFLDNK